MAFNISYRFIVNDGFSRNLRKFQKQAIKAGRAVAKMERATSRSFKKMGAAAERVRNKTAVMSTAFAAFGALTGRTVFGFERSMNKVSAITNASAADMLKLRNAAKFSGETTQFSASQSAEAIGFLAQAGLKTNQILMALPGTLDLAAASGLNLGAAADLATNVLAGFGLKVGELNRVNNVLAKTATMSNTNVTELGSAMFDVGPSAKAAGVELEEISSILGIMADSGIKGSKAGLALSFALSRMVKPTKESQRVLRRLGVNPRAIVDSQGKIKDFTGVIEKLRDSGINLAQAMTIFGEEAGRKVLTFLSKGGRDIRGFTKDLQNSTGAVKEMAKRMNLDIVGTTREMISAFEAAQISLGESGLRGAFDKFFKTITEYLRAFTKLDAGTQKFIGVAIIAVAALAPLLTVIGLMASGASALLIPIRLIGPAIGLLSTGAGLLTGVIGLLSTGAGLLTGVIGLLSKGFIAMNAVLLANPIILIGAAIAALIVGVVRLITILDDLKKTFADKGFFAAISQFFGFEPKAFKAAKLKQAPAFSFGGADDFGPSPVSPSIGAGAALERQRRVEARMDGDITVRAMPGTEVKRTESTLKGAQGNLGLNIAGAFGGG